MQGATGTRAATAALVVVVAAVAVTFLVAVAPWATDGFGYSADGFNGSVWGLGARAGADAPIASRLGGIQPDGHPYANHPPLTVWTASIASAVSGDRPGAVRSPAVVATILALAVLALLLRDAGLRWEAAAAGVVLAGTTGMLLTYGAMLDTPMVGLPFGLAALAAAQRVWQARPPPTVVVVLVGALAVLSGWQAALIAGLAVGVILLAPTADDAPSPRRGAFALGAGLAAGLAVTLAWIGWVHGSLRPLLDQAEVRSGVDGRGTDASWWTAMQLHLTDLYGPIAVLLVVAAAVVVALVVPLGVSGTHTGGGEAPPGAARWWRPAGLRPVAALLVVAVLGYIALFRNGAAVHDYWTYWGVALVGVGAAAAVELLLTRTPLRRLSPVGAALVIAAVVLPLAVIGDARQTTAETRIRDGLELLPVLGRVPEATDPHAVNVAVYGAGPEVPFADHLAHGHAVPVSDVAGLRQLPPDLPVLVVLRGPASPALRAIAIAYDRRFALVAAADLARHLGG